MKMRYLKPTKYQLELKPGGAVLHRKYGIGHVIQQWGVWESCRQCYAPNYDCRHTAGKLKVSGEGVFDIKFFSRPEIRAINCVWLTPI